MKGAGHSISSWPLGRFLAVVAFLFILQAGLIFLFGNSSRPRQLPREPSTHFWALSAPVSADQLLRQFFASDPAIFPIPGAHGFSGRAWLNQPSLQYPSENQLEPPDWLTFDAAPLDTSLPSLPSTPTIGLADFQTSREEPWPAFLPPETAPTQSVFHLEGALADRLLRAPTLHGWTNAQPLTRTVVQIAVNPAGEVIATRLDGRSGLAGADADALARTRALLFTAQPSAPTQWGDAIFEWQTTPPSKPAPTK